MMNITPTVKQLLIINIIFFIGCELSPHAKELFSLYPFQNENFRVWQLLTHMFMHANILHIFFNMFALFSFGSALEHFWGGKKFLFFYISCGLGAAFLQLGINYIELQNLLQGVSDLNLTHAELHRILNIDFSDGFNYRSDLLLEGLRPILEEGNKIHLLNESNLRALFNAGINNQIPMVGASGAIYGLLVAFAFMFPNAQLGLMFIPIPIKAKYFVSGILLIDLILGLQGSSIFGAPSNGGVAHFAHLGGALTGFLMMWYWKKNQFNRNRWN
jgi:membrane associated rhomboid family serine protease